MPRVQSSPVSTGLLLSPSELAQFRQDAEQLLPDTAVITRPFEVSDDEGGYDTTWTAIGTVAARTEPLTRKPGEEIGKEIALAEAMWTIITPAGADIRPVDRVNVSGVDYEVVGARTNRSDEITVRLYCSLLDAGGYSVS